MCIRDRGIIVRNRNSVSLCGNCLRVTVGTRGENEKLIEALKEYMASSDNSYEYDRELWRKLYKTFVFNNEALDLSLIHISN